MSSRPRAVIKLTAQEYDLLRQLVLWSLGHPLVEKTDLDRDLYHAVWNAEAEWPSLDPDKI